MNSDTILEMKGITKIFPGVKALDQVDFDLKRGEVHALLGENGSGKSTLIKVLGGIHKAEEGEIFIDGEKAEIEGVHDADKYGVSIVHQELSFAPDMTVGENIFMGKEPKGKFGLVDSKKVYRDSEKILREFGSDIDPDKKMNALSISRQQVVEIAKALSNNAKIVVMDEPSASLSLKEVENLYKTVDKLKEMGISVIYVSHRMEELFRLCDRVTVLRDGEYVGTREIKDITEDDLVSMMVGRTIAEHYTTHQPSDEVILKVENISCGDMVKNVDLELHKGEVIGISGIVGAGRSEFARILAGIDTDYKGKITLEGKPIRIHNPVEAMKHGIILVPEDRKKQGLVLSQTVDFNLSLCVLKEFIGVVGINSKKQRQICDGMIEELNIKVTSGEMTTQKLSGGNQQKVVIGKALATNPKILLLDEPTRGIDVGAKAEIYDLIDKLAKKGMAVIIISSELPEIMRVSDTVYVMRRGETVARIPKEQLDEEVIIKHATMGGNS